MGVAVTLSLEQATAAPAAMLGIRNAIDFPELLFPAIETPPKTLVYLKIHSYQHITQSQAFSENLSNETRRTQIVVK